VGQTLIYGKLTPWSRRFVKNVWDSQADMIHQQWGNDEHDYEVLSRMLTTYHVQSVLDIGCGSGRLFKLYLQYGVRDIVGVDISERALALARERYPTIETINCRLENLVYPPNRFDLAICNRILQHIPPHAIAECVALLCTVAGLVYINELADSDSLAENFYMRRYNYPIFFARNGFRQIEQGLLGQQTYQLYQAIQQ
jgi:ubiquinone/menaquinone biosynthesis C-methylase UbiE